jgi:hypothetical protein
MLKTCRKGLHQYEGRRCKECRNAGSAAWRKANSERVKAGIVAWRAENPERVKQQSASWYAKNRESKIAYSAAWVAANPERVKATAAAWRAANHERYRAKQARWYAAHPERTRQQVTAWRAANPDVCRAISAKRRALKRAATVEPVTKQDLCAMFDSQDGLCYYCRTPLGAERHLEHKTPLSRGGAHAVRNLCWACPSCNCRKHTQTEAEFIEAMAKRTAQTGEAYATAA